MIPAINFFLAAILFSLDEFGGVLIGWSELARLFDCSVGLSGTNRSTHSGFLL